MDKFEKMGWVYYPDLRIVESPTGETIIHSAHKPTDEEMALHMLQRLLLVRAPELPICVETDTMFNECAMMARAFPPAVCAAG